jgi:hypothetical protein
MAWGFRNTNNKLIAVHQVMGRIINRSFSLQEGCPELLDSGEQRCESRVKRNCPVVVFGADNGDGFTSKIIGFTHDISLNGVAILSINRMELGRSIVAIGDANNRVLLEADCISCSPRELGCFLSSFRLCEALNQNDYLPLMACVEQLEDQLAAAR